MGDAAILLATFDDKNEKHSEEMEDGCRGCSERSVL